MVLVAAYSRYLLYPSDASKEQWGNFSQRPPFYGIWTVEELAVDGVARPPLLTDATRWRRVRRFCFITREAAARSSAQAQGRP